MIIMCLAEEFSQNKKTVKALKWCFNGSLKHKAPSLYATIISLNIKIGAERFFYPPHT